MGKLKLPLLGFDARGTIANAISFTKRRGRHIAEKKPIPTDVKSPLQLEWRHMYQKAVALWHALSAAEKLEWESLARPKHMTGFAWFMSQCLRPNPGIYLPLQGGTMSGDIDMAKNRLLKLPSPTDGQEATRKSYVDAEITDALYVEGARVYHNVTQSIPNGTWTTPAFNSQDFDTDTIHDPATNNSRLTCKTAGKYIIMAHMMWLQNATGWRGIRILLNGTTFLDYQTKDAMTTYDCSLLVATIYPLIVGDWVEVPLFQNSGGPLNAFYSPKNSIFFMMQRIG